MLLSIRRGRIILKRTILFSHSFMIKLIVNDIMCNVAYKLYNHLLCPQRYTYDIVAIGSTCDKISPAIVSGLIVGKVLALTVRRKEPYTDSEELAVD